MFVKIINNNFIYILIIRIKFLKKINIILKFIFIKIKFIIKPNMNILITKHF